MRKIVTLLCFAFVLSSAGYCLAMDPVLIGDFEDGSETISTTDIRWDDWMINADSHDSYIGVTSGSKSLRWYDADGGSWQGSDTQIPYGTELDERLEAWLNPGSCISVDVTAFANEVEGGWISMNLYRNCSGGWGFDDDWQEIVIDGEPHTYVFFITDEIRTTILDSMASANPDSWGCNLGLTTKSADDTESAIYIDNIWIYPDGPVDPSRPHQPVDSQVLDTVDPDFVHVTLNWIASEDPGDPNRLPDPNFLYPLNPDIVDEYVFIGDTESADDLYYVGSAGDPGIEDPSVEYGPVILASSSTYYWAVVDALDGYSQLLDSGSKLSDVDPNNLIGPIWPLVTKGPIPEIITQPVSQRMLDDQVSIQFTVDVNSVTPEVYQWFYSKDAVKDEELGNTGVDNPIRASIGGDTNTVTASNNKAYQAYYYCRIGNSGTEAGGGPAQDVYSDIVSLVVERQVAAYTFDGNLNDSSGEGNNGTGVGSPVYVTGVNGSGSALSLDGSTQYVEIGDPADPNTFNLCFPRADLLGEKGIGGGLDAGTIRCWVKLDSTVADQLSPIMVNGNGGWPHTAFEFGVSTDSDGVNTFPQTAIWGDDQVLTIMNAVPVWAAPYNIAGDGQWHMIATTWDRNAGTIQGYMDGNLLASWSADPSEFSAWDNTMTIGFDGTNYFGGSIDNLEVYNYALSAETIADYYHDITGESSCIYLNFPGNELDTDKLGSSYCRLDLADFADFAAAWLADGFYPAQ